MTDLDDRVDPAEVLHAAAVAHTARAEISTAAALLAARPLDESAADQLRAVLGARAAAGRAAAARLTRAHLSSDGHRPARAGGETHLRLLHAPATAQVDDTNADPDTDSGARARPQVAPSAGPRARRPATFVAPAVGGGAA